MLWLHISRSTFVYVCLTSKNVVGPLGLIWDPQNYLGLLGLIWDPLNYLGTPEFIWDPLDYLGPQGFIWDFGTSLTFFVNYFAAMDNLSLFFLHMFWLHISRSTFVYVCLTSKNIDGVSFIDRKGFILTKHTKSCVYVHGNYIRW